MIFAESERKDYERQKNEIEKEKTEIGIIGGTILLNFFNWKYKNFQRT